MKAKEAIEILKDWPEAEVVMLSFLEADYIPVKFFFNIVRNRWEVEFQGVDY